MTNKTIKLTFIQDIGLDNILIRPLYTNLITGFGATIRSRLQFAPRINNGQVQIWDPNSADPSPYTSTPGEYTANLYATFLNIDKPSWIAEVESFDNIVYIVASDNTIDNNNIQFTDLWLQIDNLNGSVTVWNDGPNYVSFELLDSTNFAIQDVSYSENAIPCSNAQITIQASQEIGSVLISSSSDFTATPIGLPDNFPQVDVFTIGVTRGVPYSFLLESKFIPSDPNIEYDNIDRYPDIGKIQVPLLLESDFDIVEVPSTSGASVFIIYNGGGEFIVLLEFEYSLNNVDWFSENLLTGQVAGDYTIYIRDQFGCVISFSFTVENSAISLQPYHYISEANAIDFALVQDINNCTFFSNYKNTFAINGLSKIKYCEDILFEKCDVILTQIKTSYSDVVVTLMKHGEENQNVPVLQRTNNFNFFESFDCNVYNYSSNYAGVYFTTGNKYNELGDSIDTFELNGDLPNFVKEGQVIIITGYGAFSIESVIYDENIDKKVFLIQNNFVSLPSQEIVSCIYNILEYNVFEFGFIFDQLGVGNYRVKIDLTDEKFDDVSYISENIYVAEKHENTLCIDYFSSNNRDIFYKFGIKHRIRLEYLDIDYDFKDESENVLGDDKAQLVKSIINKKDKYYFDALTEKRRTTLVLSLSSEFCFINGISYVKDSGASLNHIRNTNLAYVEQEMIVANESYNLSRQRIGLVDSVLISGFVTSGINFLNI